jgi:hypothetical protein
MPWSYSQKTGQLKFNGIVVGKGYSGAGLSAKTGRNNSEMEDVRNKGPIPRGQWNIGTAYADKKRGPVVLALTPVGHNAHGRTDFLIHGNNSKNDASEGCIILGPDLRKKVANSGDTILTVTE